MVVSNSFAWKRSRSGPTVPVRKAASNHSTVKVRLGAMPSSAERMRVCPGTAVRSSHSGATSEFGADAVGIVWLENELAAPPAPEVWSCTKPFIAAE